MKWFFQQVVLFYLHHNKKAGNAMRLFAENAEEMENFVRHCGVKPDKNYLYAHKKASRALEAAWDLTSPDYQYGAFFEKPHVLVFTPEKLIIQKIDDTFGKGEYGHGALRIPCKEISNFDTYTADGNHYVSFTYQEKAFEYYLAENFGGTASYDPINYEHLLSNHFYGLLKNSLHTPAEKDEHPAVKAMKKYIFGFSSLYFIFVAFTVLQVFKIRNGVALAIACPPFFATFLAKLISRNLAKWEKKDYILAVLFWILEGISIILFLKLLLQ